MKYKYKAKNKKGEIYEGLADVADKFELYEKIRKEKSEILSVEEKKERFSFINLEKIEYFINPIKTEQKVVFARNLSAMVGAGLSTSRALGVLKKQSENPKLKKVIETLEEKVGKGVNISASLSEFPKVFSSVFVAMVKAGEESGKLGESLNMIANQLEKADELKKKVKGAMIYPSVIMTAMVAIGALMMVYVVPTLTETFKQFKMDLPMSTQFIIGLSDFLVNYKILSLIIILSVIFGFYYSLKTKKGKRFFEYWLLRAPVISKIVKKTNSAKTARTLSSLLSSGVDIVHSLDITSDVLQNSYYKEVIEQSKMDIQKGAPIADAFRANEDLYPALVGEMISVGEETGELSGMLERISVFYEKETSRSMDNLTSIIEPVLMIVIGTVVGFFAISVISPIYSISGAM